MTRTILQAILIAAVTAAVCASDERARSPQPVSPIVATLDAEFPGDGIRTLRSRLVEVDVQVLHQVMRRAFERPSISLPLFEDTSVVLEVRDVSYRNEGSYTIHAVVPRGMASGMATITVKNSAVFGYISVPMVGAFTITREGEMYRVRQLDEQGSPFCAVTPRHYVGTGRKQQPQQPIGLGDDPILVRLNVIYTREVLENEDAFDQDEAALLAAIQASVDTANEVLENSLTNLVIKLVDVSQTIYGESGSMDEDLSNLRDGIVMMSEIQTAQAWRAMVCADFMSMVVFYDQPTPGGIAFVMNTPSPNFAINAVSVIRHDALGGTTLIHEMGHNMGCQHDHAESGSTGGAFPYSHGHRWIVPDILMTDDEQQYATVMTYPPYDVAVPIFSNPRVEMPTGFPTGVYPGLEGEADNSLTIIQNTPHIELFKEMIGGWPCAPTSIYTVPGDFPTIQAAIDAAADRDAIIVSPGTYAENIDFKGKAVHVRSTGPNDPAVVAATIIDGQNAGTVVTFRNSEGPNSVLNGFTVRNGNATSGGGVSVRDSSPTLANLRVIDNEALFSGAGIFVQNGNPVLHRCLFIDNVSANLGGGVYSQQSSPTFIECTVTGNTASNRGGGFYFLNGSPAITTSSLIEDNQADVSGGGIYVDHANLDISDSAIINNVSLSRGGGLYIVGGSLDLDTVEVDGNSTTVSGGGLYIDGTAVTMLESIVNDNTCSSRGGGIFIREGSAEITESEITNNDAGPLNGGFGGGLYVELCEMTIVESVINGNTAGALGGGIYIWVDEEEDEEDWIIPHISLTEICMNIPNNIDGAWEDEGGNDICALDFDILVPGDYPTIQAAIDVSNDGDVIVVSPGTYFERIDFKGKGVHLRSVDPTDSAIVNATIIDGEGGGNVVLFSTGELPSSRLNGFTITGGAALHGGGIRIQSSSPTVENCIITNNSATSVGGGMAVFNSSAAIRDNGFVGNTANGSGGGVYIESSNSMSLQNCVFESNHSNSLGGGLANLASSQTMINIVFLGNSAGQWGGGMFSSNASVPTMINISFINNTATQGGGLYNSANSPAEISDSLFCENSPGNIQGPWVDLGGNNDLEICPPLNNSPNNPLPIGNSIETIVGSFTGATRNGTSTCDPMGIDVFFSYTVFDGPSTLSLDTCGSAGDTAIAVFASNGTELGCNAACLSGPCGAPAACLDVPALPNGTYLIRISRTDSLAVGGGNDQFNLHFHEKKVLIDLNSDGSVDVSDLLILLGAWGPCDSCQEDFNADNSVDVGDLLLLLANWG